MSKMSATQRRRRAYGKSGLYGIRSATPEVLDRARDESIAPEDLTALERGARALRLELLQDTGGVEEASAAKRILIDTVVGSAVALGTVDRFMIEELGGSLIDRRSQKVRRVVLDRDKLAGSLSRMLALLGLEKRRTPPTLVEYLQKRQEVAQAAEDATGGAEAGDSDREVETRDRTQHGGGPS